MPFISVVIPTRNRAHLLRYALQSVVTQDWDDFEIIVSDNDSSDNTRQVVERYADKRIRYVRTDKYLYLYDHWNFAFRKASGRYLLLLADDDALVPNALLTFFNLVETTANPFIGCRFVDYYSPDFPVKSRQNTLFVPPFTGEVKQVESRYALDQCFRFNPAYYPLATTLISKEIIDDLFRRFGKFFDEPFQEHIAYPMAYSTIPHYIQLDKPLVVLGRTPDSLGPRYFWFNQDATWSESGDNLFQYAPLKGTYITNGVAEALLRAKHNLPENFQDIEMSMVDYYRSYYADMLAQQKIGRDIRHDLDECRRMAATLSTDLRTEVERAMQDAEREQLADVLPALATVRSGAWRRWASGIKRRLSSPSVPLLQIGTLRGEQVGVHDILSCAKWVGSLAPNQ